MKESEAIADHTLPSCVNVFGEPAWFDIADDSRIPPLSVRERRLLIGAVNFHTALVPGRSLTFHVYDGDPWLTPRTTDDRTFDGKSRVFRRRLYSFEAIGRLPDPQPLEHAEFKTLTASDHRHLYISPDAVLRHDPRRWVPNDYVRRGARAIRNRAPIVYDELRDIELLRHRGHERTIVRRRNYLSEFAPGGPHERETIVPPAPPGEGARAAVLIGVHWFELGGAERWAFETVRIVRDQGLLPIVLSNVESQHPFLARPELDGALILPLSQPTSLSQPAGREPLLAQLLATFDVRATVVHHNQWLYDRLPWLALARPEMPIVDSTHILEHRGGGYAVSSVRVDPAIGTHHVISPSLARWMRDVQRVDRAKIVMAPLAGLTVEEQRSGFRERGVDEPFTVSFVGRMARQKAPEVFVEAAKRAHRADRDIRFIVHGDGEHAAWVDELIDRGGLGAVVTRRTSTTPVPQTLAESHLLVITSANEGLTLTTMEALAAGVPVLSTDVGAQSDIIPPGGLLPPSPMRTVRAAGDAIVRLASDEGARRRLWSDERARERELFTTESAVQWFERTAKTWSMSPQSS